MTTTIELLGKLQDSLNEEIAKDWKCVRDIKEFETNCLRELGELLQCIPDKWWKDYSDEEKIKLKEKEKLELVDVLHFALGGSLFDGTLYDKSYIIPYKTIDTEKYKDLMRLSLVYNFQELVYQIIAISQYVPMDLLSYYLAKYTLNRIRIIKGYKTGEYKKVNNNIEDNEVILKYIPSTKYVTQVTELKDEKRIKEYTKMINDIYDEFSIPIDLRFKLEDYI